MDAILQKFRDKYIEEAQGLIDNLEKDLLEMEKGDLDKEMIESAFRAMHTLKGVSSMYGFEFISEFTHHLESIWQNVRDNRMEFSRQIFEITFDSIDHIRKLLTDEKLLNPENKANNEKLLARAGAIIKTSPLKDVRLDKPATKSPELKSTWHILLMITEKLFFRGISLKNIISDLIELGEYEISKVESLSDPETDVWSFILNTNASENDIRDVFLFVEDNCTLVNLTKENILSESSKKKILAEPEVPKVSILDYLDGFDEKNENYQEPEENKKEIEHSTFSKQPAKRISVDASKLDHLMFLVSELITVNSQLNLAAETGQMKKMKVHLEKVDTLSKQFRNNAFEIRLVPLGDTVLRFQRLIRDLSNQLGKKVEFKTAGIETELDKNTIDQLAEPLMHIIRNSLDHGIEIPEKRIEKGKPEQGKVSLQAYNSGNFVIIKITDDGNGVDIDKVKNKAIDKKLIKASDNHSDKEILDLIFLPGFSTAQNLTSVSGRGVGMDVVKKRILDLRGEVFVTCEKGKGTTFTLKIPQSLSIVDTLLFTVEDSFFTVPISEIVVCLQFKPGLIEERKNTATLPYNDQLISYIDLRQIMKIEGVHEGMYKAIILKNEHKEIALIADKIIGEHQAVLKPLGKSFRSHECISSASQMGDGQMAFMLDTNTLFNSITI